MNLALLAQSEQILVSQKFVTLLFAKSTAKQTPAWKSPLGQTNSLILFVGNGEPEKSDPGAKVQDRSGGGGGGLLK